MEINKFVLEELFEENIRKEFDSVEKLNECLSEMKNDLLLSQIKLANNTLHIVLVTENELASMQLFDKPEIPELMEKVNDICKKYKVDVFDVVNEMYRRNEKGD